MASKWWNSKTPAQKKAYIKAHPNSMYAKTRRPDVARKRSNINKKVATLTKDMAGSANARRRFALNNAKGRLGDLLHKQANETSEQTRRYLQAKIIAVRAEIKTIKSLIKGV